MMVRIRKTSPIYHAICFDSALDHAELVALLQGQLYKHNVTDETKMFSGLELQVHDGRWVTVHMGDWIVRFEDGCGVISALTFEHVYEHVLEEKHLPPPAAHEEDCQAFVRKVEEILINAVKTGSTVFHQRNDLVYKLRDILDNVGLRARQEERKRIAKMIER